VKPLGQSQQLPATRSIPVSARASRARGWGRMWRVVLFFAVGILPVAHRGKS